MIVTAWQGDVKNGPHQFKSDVCDVADGQHPFMMLAFGEEGLQLMIVTSVISKSGNTHSR